MTMIHDIHDLFRLLDANPEYRAELRRYVLSEELLNLPARFDHFVEDRFEPFEKRFDRFEERMDRFVEDQRRINREIREDIGGVRREMAEMRQDLGQVKGDHALSRTIRRAPFIAMTMGMTYVRTLTMADLAIIVQGADVSGIALGEIASFIDADLVIEVIDGDGQTAYVATEISYTANRRDTGRAIRNAGFLSQFTGQPARPAIASIRNDPEIADLISGGQVYWHTIYDRDLEPE